MQSNTTIPQLSVTLLNMKFRCHLHTKKSLMNNYTFPDDLALNIILYCDKLIEKVGFSPTKDMQSQPTIPPPPLICMKDHALSKLQ